MAPTLYNKFRRITTNQLYFPEIDGIRFLAISLVIIYHVYLHFISHTNVAFTDNHGSYTLINTFLNNTFRGVEMFFVLSGFVLCLPFAHHYINKGKKVALKHYYLRRLTRLEPPYFIAITGIFLLQAIFKPGSFSNALPNWLATLAYSHNIIFHTESLITVVAWSLEIEIQFYILAPFLFSVLSQSAVTRRLILVLASIAIVCLAKYFPLPVRSLYDYIQFFLAGILLADVYVSDTAGSVFRKKWIAFFSLICLIVILYLPLKGENFATGILLAGNMLLPLAISLFFYMVLKNDIIKSIFSYKFIPIIGGMCYSIYLLHYTLIGMLGRFTNNFRFSTLFLPNLALQVLLLTIPILVVSAVFYLYIERPFMSSRWMNKLLKKDKYSAEANSIIIENKPAN